MSEEIKFLREHIEGICAYKGLQRELTYDVSLEILKRVCIVLDFLELENQLLKRNCNIGNENLTFYKEEYTKLKDKIDKAIEVIDTQMKLAEDGAKDNLRIIKFYLIKGSCSMHDLTTEEDYKYKKGGNNEC